VPTVSFDSHALGHAATFTVIVPQQPAGVGGYSVLLVLHGLGRNQRTLLDQPETHDLMLRQNALLVMPDSGRGWWIDSDAGRYDAMLLEVVAEVQREFPVSRDPTRWGVIGWSMGGFGAMRFAERHPEAVSFVGTIIGLLDFPRGDLPKDQSFAIDARVFGADPSLWPRENPSQHLGALAGKDIVLVIGEQAFDRTMNENFLRAAVAAGLPVEAHRIPGGHLFPTVVAGLEILLPRAQEHFERARGASP
jgi:S-formylglutathione hydrolase FrmB